MNYEGVRLSGIALIFLISLLSFLLLGCGGGGTMGLSGSTDGHAQHHAGLKVRSWAYQLQGADPERIAESGFELVVIDYSRDGSEEGEYSREEIDRLKSSGVIPIAYISIGEAESYRFYWKEEWNTTPPEWLGRENPEWRGNYAVKYWHPEWRSIIHAYLDRIIGQGFSGIYLDKVDAYEYWSDPSNGEDEHLSEEEAASRMIELIEDIVRYVRARGNGRVYVIPQNGEGILRYDNGTLLRLVDGWAAEDLFYNGTERWSDEEMEWVVEHRIPFLDMVLSKDKPILSVDYVDDGTGYSGANRERIDDYRRRALERGYIPYAAISDRELDELNVIDGVQP